MMLGVYWGSSIVYLNAPPLVIIIFHGLPYRVSLLNSQICLRTPRYYYCFTVFFSISHTYYVPLHPSMFHNLPQFSSTLSCSTSCLSLPQQFYVPNLSALLCSTDFLSIPEHYSCMYIFYLNKK